MSEKINPKGQSHYYYSKVIVGLRDHQGQMELHLHGDKEEMRSA